MNLTEYYYLASDKQLPIGSFGSSSYIRGMDWKDEYGAGIFVEKEESVSKHFSLPYQVSIRAELGSFQPDDYSNISTVDYKCLETLFNYIHNVASAYKECQFQLLSSINSKENEPVKNHKKILLKQLKSPTQLILENQELLDIKKQNTFQRKRNTYYQKKTGLDFVQ